MNALNLKFSNIKFARYSLSMFVVLLAVFLSVIFTKEGGQYSPPPELGLYISYGEGEFLINKSDTGWKPASYGTVLFNGDGLRTGNNSRVTLQSPWGITVRLGEDTEISVIKFSANDILLAQSYGTTYHKIIMHNDDSAFSYQVRALNNTIQTKGGIFDLSTNLKDMRTKVKILDGKINMAVSLADIIEVQKIGKGKEITVDPGNENLVTLSDITSDYLSSAWYLWNKQEDEKYSYAAEGSGVISVTGTQTNNGTSSATKNTNAGATSTSKTTQTQTGSCKPSLWVKKAATYNGIFVNWTTCKSDDFQFYKVVRSSINKNPSYPNDPVVSSSSNRSYANFIDKTVAFGMTYYYRVCVVERLGKVTCSNVASVTY